MDISLLDKARSSILGSYPPSQIAVVLSMLSTLVLQYYLKSTGKHIFKLANRSSILRYSY